MNRMVKVKSALLTPLALDFLIAQIEGEAVRFDRDSMRHVPGQFSDESIYTPSSDAEIGHMIIEREKIQLRYIDSPGHKLHGLWLAQDCRFRPTSTSVDWIPFGKSHAELQKGYFTGPTSLMAALRFFVCMRLGEMVEIPAEFICA